MKFWLAFGILLFASSFSLAQGKYNANWVFGDKAGINFSDTTRPFTFVTKSDNLWGSATLSDSNGNLLFYIAPDTFVNNGIYPYAIYNGNNEIIPNGDSINVSFDAGIDGAIFLNTPNIILLHIEDSYGSIDGQPTFQSFIYYSVINKTDNGYYVAKKNQKIFNSEIEDKMAVVKHANGKDWWLLVHKDSQGIPDSATNRFYKFLITEDSISGPYIQDIGILHSSPYCFFGCMSFNRQGNMLATALADQGQSELFQFDRCTGSLSDFQLISNVTFNNIADCAFSPSGNKLYLLGSSAFLDNVGYNALYQYAVDTSGVNNTQVIIWEDNKDIGVDQPSYFQSLSLAADNNIYISVSGDGWPNYYPDSNNQYLWVINDPDSSGLACNFQPYGFYLGDSATTYGSLPTMLNYNLGPLSSIWQSIVSGDTVICKADSSAGGVILTLDTAPGVSFLWQAGPGIIDTSFAQQTVKPTQSTWYYVTFTDTTIIGSCQSRTDSVLVQVICCDSLQLLQCTLSKDTFICTNKDTPTKGATLTVDTVPGISFMWQPGFNIDTNHTTQQIVDPPQSIWYYVTFFSDSNYSNSCTRTDSVYVEVKLCDTLGIQQVNEPTQHLKIYPNPAQNTAVIEWQPINVQLQLSVSDLLGREMNSFKVDGMSGKAEMDISSLVNGLYVVRLLSPAGGGEGGGSGKLTVIK